MTEAFPVALFGLWFLATCAASLAGQGRTFGRFEPLTRLIPTWNFFAPTPSESDFRVLFRDQLVDGSVSPWREINSILERRPWWSLAWNAGQREKKALFDVCQELTVGSKLMADTPSLVPLSTAYLAVLAVVSALDRSPISRATQFVVVATSRAQPEPRVLFISGMHKVDGPRAPACGMAHAGS